MAVRRNPDGSMTVGILPEEPKEVKPEVKAEQPKAEKPKRTAKSKDNGEG